MWKQWVNFILGLIVLFLAFGSGDVWDMVLGIVIAILAIWSALEKKSGAAMPAK